jgi:rfaE bifunctional protein kinase chain/domain
VNAERFQVVTGQYHELRVAVLGDYCLDRYLEIDPARAETSIETGLPVHNVVNVRPQPGGAGTIVNNLSALGIGTIYPIGFAGFDGEGFELWHALERVPGVQLNYFTRTAQRRTFTYCKPLIVAPGHPPVELNRLDSKNWTPTPGLVEGLLIKHLEEAVELADAVIILDQVDVPETGVVTRKVLASLKSLAEEKPDMPVLADSRRGLRGYPPVIFKMNAAELSALTGTTQELRLEDIKEVAGSLASKNGRSVFVSLAAGGIVGATATGETQHIAALPLRGEIDVVGAGDAVSANLTSAMAASATLHEALELANAAASVVIHKLGTTGTATVSEIGDVLRWNGQLGPHPTSET